MADIKFRNVVKGTIKTYNGTVKTINRSIKEGTEIKRITQSSTEALEPSEGLGNAAQGTELYIANKAINSGKRRFANSASNALKLKKRQQTTKSKIKTIKHTADHAKYTAKTGWNNVSASVKYARQTIKSARQVQSQASKAVTVKQRIQLSKNVAKVTIQATKYTLKATYEVIKATFNFVFAAGTWLTSLIAAGGWIAIMAIILIAVIAGIITSAVGVVFSNDIHDTNSLSKAQSKLNTEFSTVLSSEKAKLIGYEKVVVRPAPVITQWNDIVAVYAVRAEKKGISASEFNDEATELLRQTLWDMLSFSVSEETVVSESEDVGQAQVSETFGILNVIYLSVDEAATKYGFSDSDKELLSAVQEMQLSVKNGIIASGNGTLINPCPDGHFNGNDYPAYAKSGEYHAGRDISCPIGTNIYAAGSGTVVNINDQAATYGKHLIIDHGGELYTLYAHCSQLLVSVGDTVEQGQLIALSGATGNVTGPHLHFEVRVGGKRFRVNNVDPLEWIG